MAVRQCTLCVQKLNIFSLIFHYIYRKLNTYSCNEIIFTNIPLYFLLKQHLSKDIIKLGFKVDIFITCCQFILCFLIIMTDDFLSLVESRKKLQDKNPKNCIFYTYSRMQYFSVFSKCSAFICLAYVDILRP